MCDNASANDVMMKKLAENKWERLEETGRIRCFAHILNLIVGVSERVQTFERPTSLLKTPLLIV